MNEYLAACGTTMPIFRADQQRGETALAFGAQRFLPSGVVYDADCLAARLRDELTASFPRKKAAELVIAFSSVWAEAVICAERASEPVFLVILERGERLRAGTKYMRPAVNMGFGTMQEIADRAATAKLPMPPRLTLLGVADLLVETRSAAANAGVDLSAPFFPDDECFMAELKDENATRERMLARWPTAEARA